MAATKATFAIGDRVRRPQRRDRHGTIEAIENATGVEPQYRVRWDATPGFTMPLIRAALERCEPTMPTAARTRGA
jgi:hypothetical protein